jgi:hypothetical protein
VARYAQIDIAFADEGRYIGRREEDAVIMIFSLVYTYGSRRNRSFARALADAGEWRDRAGVECGDVQCDVVVLH